MLHRTTSSEDSEKSPAHPVHEPGFPTMLYCCRIANYPGKISFINRFISIIQ
ncbi:hypothetical protein CSC33_2378 [Pseudomonas aeruginosa]|nr:hypothetical protein CSC33_2378 [Pseudomonas aeruginosa]